MGNEISSLGRDERENTRNSKDASSGSLREHASSSTQLCRQNEEKDERSTKNSTDGFLNLKLNPETCGKVAVGVAGIAALGTGAFLAYKAYSDQKEKERKTVFHDSCFSKDDSEDEDINQLNHVYTRFDCLYNPSNKNLTPYQGNNMCFGKFSCPQCNAEWLSANSWANMGQKCKKCRSDYVYPHEQWPLKNKSTGFKYSEPHQEELCEKCQILGEICTSAGQKSSGSKTRHY